MGPDVQCLEAMRPALAALILVATLASAAEPARTYVVSWGTSVERSAEKRAVVEQFDRKLRDELHRRGAIVLDRDNHSPAIVLRPRLEVTAKGLRLNLVALRSGDQQLLGSISLKAAGASREAQVRALVTRACLEAEELQKGPLDSALADR